MVQSQPPRLNEFHKAAIEVLLRHAIAKKETFNSIDQLVDYLRRAGFADTLLHNESKIIIFNIYLGLIHNLTQSPQQQSPQQQPPESSQQPIQLLSLSPTSASSSSEPAPNPAKGILEGVERRDDIESLDFLSRVSYSSEQIALYANKLGCLRH